MSDAHIEQASEGQANPAPPAEPRRPPAEPRRPPAEPRRQRLLPRLVGLLVKEWFVLSICAILTLVLAYTSQLIGIQLIPPLSKLFLPPLDYGFTPSASSSSTTAVFPLSPPSPYGGSYPGISP